MLDFRGSLLGFEAINSPECCPSWHLVWFWYLHTRKIIHDDALSGLWSIKVFFSLILMCWIFRGNSSFSVVLVSVFAHTPAHVGVHSPTCSPSPPLMCAYCLTCCMHAYRWENDKSQVFYLSEWLNKKGWNSVVRNRDRNNSVKSMESVGEDSVSKWGVSSD